MIDTFVTQRFRLHWLSAGGLALMLAACGGDDNAGATSASAPGDAAGATVQQAQLEAGSAEYNGAPDAVNEKAGPVLTRSLAQGEGDRPTPRVIVLPELTAAEAPPQAQDEPGKSLQIGVGRDIPQTADAKAMAGLLSWSTAANGSRRAAISVRSPGAAALRFGLLVEQLPQQAVLRVYAPGAEQAREVAGKEVLNTIQSNLDAGDSGVQQAHTYWLPSVEGDQTVLEIELPAGVGPASLKVSLPRVSHRYTSESILRKMWFGEGKAGSCNVNVMCNSNAKNDSTRRAIGWMTFVADDAATHGCSGTLLNTTEDNDSPKKEWKPYFLSANHCIPNQSVANTVEVTWDYRTVSCNDSSLSPVFNGQFEHLGRDKDGRLVVGQLKVAQGGAELKYTSKNTDTSFMLLNSKLPAGLLFAGWNARAQPSTRFDVHSFHQPKGDTEKYSAGTIISYMSCQFSWCKQFSLPKNHLSGIGYPFYEVIWGKGVTEPGSSGGPLFSSNSKQVIGQLWGGFSSCSNPNGSDKFGRFDIAYKEGNLAKWLDPQ
ncbi:MAG: hypothetical protein LBF16_01365 [Pseudomonadales bacterium]|jgi:hypothetical protein|nr:hypothetical protein [Pseudomonadales bacterium]